MIIQNCYRSHYFRLRRYSFRHPPGRDQVFTRLEVPVALYLNSKSLLKVGRDCSLDDHRFDSLLSPDWTAAMLH